MANTEPKQPTGLDLDWSMAVDNKHLAIEYTVTNRTDKKVWLLDRLIANAKLDPAAVVVGDADEPKTVAFTRGFVRTNIKTLTIPPPIARPLDPGQSITDTARAPLPLAAYLNYANVGPLAGGATHAIFAVGYVDDPSDAAVTTRDLPDGSTVTVAAPASMGSQKLLRGERKPLPDAAR